jgi:1-phosphofructokinase family hexose kinase
LKRGIFTFTPNPVLDLGGSVKHVIPDEKVYVHDETRSPGGNGINAARIIDRLGADVVLSGFLGGGVGKEVQSLLDKEKLRTRFVPIQADTRIGITVSSLDSHTQTRLSFPGPRIRPIEKAAFVKMYDSIPSGSLVLLGGSLPPGFGVGEVRKMIHHLQQKNIGLIVDVPSTALKELLFSGAAPSRRAKPRALLIKPNLVEFQELTGSKVRSIAEVVKKARELTIHVPLICVSSVEGGALLVSADGAWFGRIPKVKINSVVGAGDSMVGAIAVQLGKQIETQRPVGTRRWTTAHLASGQAGEWLRWGLAAACASLSHRGTDLGTAAEIKKYYKLTKVRRIETTTRKALHE